MVVYTLVSAKWALDRLTEDADFGKKITFSATLDVLRPIFEDRIISRRFDIV